jgi:hypothetical protein
MRHLRFVHIMIVLLDSNSNYIQYKGEYKRQYKKNSLHSILLKGLN